MDKPTKDIAEHIMSRLQFDARHKNQAPIGRVKVLFGPEKKEETLWIMRKESAPEHRVHRDITGHIRETSLSTPQHPKFGDGKEVFRDTPVGRIIMESLGCYTFNAPKGELMVASVNKASFTTPAAYWQIDAINTLIELENKESRFASLAEALERLGKLRHEERKLEDALRQQQKAQRTEEDLDKQAEQIRQELAATQSKISEELASLARFRNDEVKLRDQPVLDAAQEEVKRSNLLNGGLIISGAPGTGKTTSLIQRISFLTAPTLCESVDTLTNEDQQFLFQSAQSWFFFSPNELLKMYLKDAMDREALSMSGDRVDTWISYRKKILRAYGWIGDSSPFNYSNETENLFDQGYQPVANLQSLFGDFLVELQQQRVTLALETSINGLEDKRVDQLRRACSATGSFKKIDQFVRLYVTLHRDFQDLTKRIRDQYKTKVDSLVNRTLAKIRYDDVLYQRVEDYARQLNQEKRQASETEDEVDEDLAEADTVLTEADEAEIAHDSRELLLVQINKLLLRLYRDLALKKAPSDLSRSLKGLWNLTKDQLFGDGIDEIRPYSFYLKVYAPLTNGLEDNLLKRYPAYYKQFRREYLADMVIVNKRDQLLILIKEGNKKLHPDEFDFLLWNLHTLVRIIYQQSIGLYNQSSNTLLASFRQLCRGVVAIDEASDFSAIQLQAMASLSHPKFNCVTLCGDLMQRMTREGIRSWDDFSRLWPNTEERTLQKAYRQTPPLLAIARRMYREIIGQEPPFISYAPSDSRYAQPLFYQHPDPDIRLAWVVRRILDINRDAKGQFPTIALFVEDDSKVRELHEKLKDNDDLLNAGLEIDACEKGRFVGDKQAVRIFSVQYIKGMEFEAVFILNIDQIDENLLNQYLYVGLTRANYYLALTAQNDLPGSIAYLKEEFKTESNWSSEIRTLN